MLSSKPIPDILYHGTTLLRWELVKKYGYLVPNKQGYIYFTTNLDKAIVHGYTRYLDDKYSGDKKYTYYYDQNPELKDCMVLYIETKSIDNNNFLWYNHFGEVWYSHTGKIPIKTIFIYEIYSLPNMLDNMEYTNNMLKSLWYKETPSNPFERIISNW